MDQLQLAQRRIAAQDVDVALDKLAHPALLRALGAVGFVDLDDLKRVRKLIAVARVEAAERQGQVIAQPQVRQVPIVLLVQRRCELVAPL